MHRFRKTQTSTNARPILEGQTHGNPKAAKGQVNGHWCFQLVLVKDVLAERRVKGSKDHEGMMGLIGVYIGSQSLVAKMEDPPSHHSAGYLPVSNIQGKGVDC